MNLMNRKVTNVAEYDSVTVTTKTDGSFAFPPEIEPFCIVVVHESGLGMTTEKEIAAGEPVQLEAWNENQSPSTNHPPTIRGRVGDVSQVAVVFFRTPHCVTSLMIQLLTRNQGNAPPFTCDRRSTFSSWDTRLMRNRCQQLPGILRRRRHVCPFDNLSWTACTGLLL